MKILIREGSAAKNLEVLAPLLNYYPDEVMLCTDDLHPETLAAGHINKLVARLISMGYDMFNVIRAASVNTFKHYGINAGLLRPGEPADFIIVDDPANNEYTADLDRRTMCISGRQDTLLSGRS